MSATAALPEATIITEYLKRDGEGNWLNTSRTLAAKYGVSTSPIKRILRNAGVARTAWETRKWRPVGNALRDALDRSKTALQGSQAIDCRMDAAWEAREHISDVIYCRECLLPFATLSGRKGHIWRVHRLTAADYRLRWPCARLIPLVCQAHHSRKGTGRQTDLKKIMAVAAAKHLAPHELSACRLDADWEGKQGNQDFWQYHVACRACGLVGSQSLVGHLRRRHKYDRTQYRRVYPKAPTSSLANLQGLRNIPSTADEADLRQKIAEKEAHIAELHKQIRETEREVGQLKSKLELERQGPAEVIRAEVAQAEPRFGKLWSHAALAANPYLLLGDWSHPDFSAEEIGAAKQRMLERTRPGNRIRYSAMQFVANAHRMAFETVRDYCKT